MALSAARIEGLWLPCKDALFLRRLEKVDSTTGGRAVYTVAVSRPTRLYLGAAAVRGRCNHFCYMLLHFESFGEKNLTCVDRLVLIRKPGSLLGYLFS